MNDMLLAVAVFIFLSTLVPRLLCTTSPLNSFHLIHVNGPMDGFPIHITTIHCTKLCKILIGDNFQTSLFFERSNFFMIPSDWTNKSCA